MARSLTPARPLRPRAEEGPNAAGSEGWVLVQLASAPERSGYVPLEYVQSAGSSAAAAAATAASPQGAASSSSSAAPAAASWAGSARPTPQALVLHTHVQAASPSAGSAGGGGFPADLGATRGGGGGPSTAEEFGQLFASHEEWFRAASAKRSEVYRALAGEAADLLRALHDSEARSAAVLARIADMDRIIQQEKQSWVGGSAAL